jgi:trk system potassium uptake protein
MYVIVIGCGRLGSNLAQELSDSGHDVCIIDRNSARLATLGSGFNGQRIQGIEFDSDNLAEGGIEQADALLAVTSDDNINITVSLIAHKIYHVPEIIARVNEPSRKYIYDKLSIETISPVQLGVEILKNRLAIKPMEILSSPNQDYEIIELLVNKPNSFAVKKIETDHSCIISGIIRDGSFLLPKPEDIIQSGDRIICTILKTNKEKLLKSLAKEVPIWKQ